MGGYTDNVYDEVNTIANIRMFPDSLPFALDEQQLSFGTAVNGRDTQRSTIRQLLTDRSLTTDSKGSGITASPFLNNASSGGSRYTLISDLPSRKVNNPSNNGCEPSVSSVANRSNRCFLGQQNYMHRRDLKRGRRSGDSWRNYRSSAVYSVQTPDKCLEHSASWETVDTTDSDSNSKCNWESSADNELRIGEGQEGREVVGIGFEVVSALRTELLMMRHEWEGWMASEQLENDVNDIVKRVEKEEKEGTRGKICTGEEHSTVRGIPFIDYPEPLQSSRCTPDTDDGPKVDDDRCATMISEANSSPPCQAPFAQQPRCFHTVEEKTEIQNASFCSMMSQDLSPSVAAKRSLRLPYIDAPTISHTSNNSRYGSCPSPLLIRGVIPSSRYGSCRYREQGPSYSVILQHPIVPQYRAGLHQVDKSACGLPDPPPLCKASTSQDLPRLGKLKKVRCCRSKQSVELLQLKDTKGAEYRASASSIACDRNSKDISYNCSISICQWLRKCIISVLTGVLQTVQKE